MSAKEDALYVLLEIGTEEIPSRFIPSALKALKKSAEASFAANRLTFNEAKTYATPRRLVLIVKDVSKSQSEQVDLLKGPPVSSAYDDNDQPTRAATGFAKSKGIDVNDLKITEINGVKYIAAEIRQESKPAIEVRLDVPQEHVLGQIGSEICASYTLDFGDG